MQSSRKVGMNDFADSSAADVLACERLYLGLTEASIRKDVSGMEEALADDYVLVHMTGMRQSKAEYIDAVCNGTLNYYKAVHESIEVELHESKKSAVIRARSQVAAAVFGGGRNTWRLQQRLKAAKRNGKWLLVESRASTY